MGPAEPVAQTRTRLVLAGGIRRITGPDGGRWLRRHPGACSKFNPVTCRSARCTSREIARWSISARRFTFRAPWCAIICSIPSLPAPQTSCRRLRASSQRDGRRRWTLMAGRSAPAEAQPVRALRTGLAAYWNVLEPALRWSPQQRRERGYAFRTARAVCRAAPPCWNSRTRSPRSTSRS